MKKPRLTWRKQPSELGLARVTRGVRGLIGKIDGKDKYRVYANGGSWRGPLVGW